MQIIPSQPLASLVRHYLIYPPETSGSPVRFFTDGSPGIVVPRASRLSPNQQKPNGKPVEPFVYGLMEQYLDIDQLPADGMVVAVLQPDALASLTQASPSLLKNKALPISTVFPSHAGLLQKKLLMAGTTMDIIATIETFLLSRSQIRDTIVADCLKLMTAKHGNITLAELLLEIPISERQLERKFNAYIGTPPKRFIGILRMTRFLKLFRNQQRSSIVQSALEAGYYDQAHLNNHFKSLTGVSPLAYRAGADPIALNLLNLSDFSNRLSGR